MKTDTTPTWLDSEQGVPEACQNAWASELRAHPYIPPDAQAAFRRVMRMGLTPHDVCENATSWAWWDYYSVEDPNYDPDEPHAFKPRVPDTRAEADWLMHLDEAQHAAERGEIENAAKALGLT
jgi:hypothetical protein